MYTITAVDTHGRQRHTTASTLNEAVWLYWVAALQQTRYVVVTDPSGKVVAECGDPFEPLDG